LHYACLEERRKACHNPIDDQRYHGSICAVAAIIDCVDKHGWVVDWVNGNGYRGVVRIASAIVRFACAGVDAIEVGIG